MKQACGLLDRPRPSERPGADDPGFGSAAHRETAREAVRKSLVLLKNEGGLLPLERGARILVVAGRNAHDRGHQCGGWTVEWQGLTGNDRVEGRYLDLGGDRPSGAQCGPERRRHRGRGRPPAARRGRRRHR